MNKPAVISILLIVLFTTGCSTRGKRVYVNDGKTTNNSFENISLNSTVDKKYHSHPTMKPYVIMGIKYFPSLVNVGDEFTGNASWYGPDFHGKLTSNGEIYNMHDMTAAHKTLPMNTIVKVINKKNGLQAVVRINDRGPFVDTRIIDLSNKAAYAIDMVEEGTAPVSIEILGFASKGEKNIPAKEELKESPQDKSPEGYAIQIASFSKIDGALEVQQKYNDADGYKTVIKDIQNDNGRIFKVWLKGFKSEQEARDYIAVGNFKNSFIVRED